jgi:hypothetical protein
MSHAQGLLGRTVVVIAAALISLAAPASAAADRRIAVLEIEGARTPRLQQALTQLVKSQHEVLRSTSYRDAARRLRAPRMTPKDIKRVCAYLELDGVLEGTLVSEGGRYKLTLRLRSGKSGAIEWKQAMYLNAPRLSDKIARQLKSKLGAAIGDLPGVGGKGKGKRSQAEEEDDEGFIDDEPPAKKVKAPPPKPAPRPAKKGKPVDDEFDDEGDDFDDEDDDDAPRGKAKPAAKGKAAPPAKVAKAASPAKPAPKAEPARPAKAAPVAKGKARPANDDDDDEGDDDEDADDDDDAPRRTAMKDGGDDDDPDAEIEIDSGGEAAVAGPAGAPLSLSAGMSFTARRLGFVVSPDLQDIPPGYKGAMVPGIHVAGDVYPMQLAGRSGLAARFGVGFMFDRVLRLVSTVQGLDGPEALTTTQQKYGIDVRYRHGFGKLTAIGSLGYSSLQFDIDKAAASVEVDVPNVHYRSIDPGLAARYQVTGKLAAIGAIRMMALLATGEIQKGEQYGVATVLGIDGDLGLEFAVTPKILVRAAGHYQRIGYTFQNKGDLTDRDDDGNADVGGAADTYFGGLVTAGYVF